MKSSSHHIYPCFLGWCVCVRSFAISLFLLTQISCADDHDGLSAWPVGTDAIQLEGVINNIESGTRGTGPIVGTKPSKNLSLNIYRADATSGTTYGSAWTTGIEGTMTATTGVIGMSPSQYYLINPAQNTKFIALHPSGGTYNSGSRTVTYTTLDGGTDIMYGAPVQGNCDDAITSTMTFTHLLTQVRVKIVAANSTAITSWGNVTGATIANKKTGCVVQLPAPNSSDPIVSVQASGTPAALALTSASGGSTGSVSLATDAKTYGYAMFVPSTDTEALSLTITTATGGSQTLSVGPQKYEAGKAYEITVNFNVREITATATLTDWTETADFTFGAPSNCYMLKPGGHTVAIPVSRANDYIDQLGESESFTAEWLWADAPNLITVTKNSGKGYTDYIHVTSGEIGNDGNAVVAIKNTSGTILWSWHIWVTDYEPDPDEDIMDRSLGATSANGADGVKTYGNLYQWGRKDPFPRPDNPGVIEPTIYTPLATKGFRYIISTNLVSNLGFATLANDVFEMSWMIRNPSTICETTIQKSNTEKTWNLIDNGFNMPCPHGWKISNNWRDSKTVELWNNRLEGTCLIIEDEMYGELRVFDQPVRWRGPSLYYKKGDCFLWNEALQHENKPYYDNWEYNISGGIWRNLKIEKPVELYPVRCARD